MLQGSYSAFLVLYHRASFMLGLASAEAPSKRHWTTDLSSTVTALSGFSGCQASFRTWDACTLSSALCCRGPPPAGMCQRRALLTPSACWVPPFYCCLRVQESKYYPMD